jgi:hypothetical protein
MHQFIAVIPFVTSNGRSDLRSLFTSSINFIAGVIDGTATKIYVVRHQNPGPCSVLNDGGSAVAEEVDERARVDLACEVLQGGVPGALRVDAEHQESFAEGLVVDVLAGPETGKSQSVPVFAVCWLPRFETCFQNSGATSAGTAAIVFFLAILPQFVMPGVVPLGAQVLVLGAILIAIGIFDRLYALGAGAAREWFGKSPKWLSRTSAWLAESR